MRARSKHNKKHKIVKKIIITILCFFLAVLVYFELTVRERIELAMIAQIKTVSHQTINSAVSNYIKENQNLCDNIISVNCDNSGNVKSISENVYTVNSLKTDIIEISQNSINKVMSNHGINVQLGNFTGLTILSEFGPYITMDVDATTTIMCEIFSNFESAGVNQTLHHTVIELYVDIYVGNPIRIESIKYKTNYEISQTVIIGSIPSAYGTISRY